MGKRKIGEIYNKPIIEGDINLKTPNEIHKSELSGGGGSEEKEWVYYKLNRETNEDMFRDMLLYLYDVYLAVGNDPVTETTSYYSQCQSSGGIYAGYIRVPKQDFVLVQWTDTNSFNQTIFDRKYFKEIMLTFFPDIEEITKEEYYSIVTIPIEQYPKTEMPTQ